MQITNEDELHNFVLNAPVGICVLDAATLNAEIVNHHFLETTGKAPEEIVGKFYWDVFAETRRYEETAMNKAVKEGRSYYANGTELILVKHSEKEPVMVNFIYSPVKNRDGKVTRIAVWVQESAGRKLDEKTLELQALNEEMATTNEELAATNEEFAAVNEELASANEELAATNEELSETHASLQRSERLFRSIALNIPNSVVVVIDKNHRYVMVEGDLMDKMGYKRDDYEGKHPTEIGQTERYNASKHLYDRMMAGEKISVERKGVSGEYYIVHLVPLKNEQGEVELGLVMAIDITDIKEAEERSAKLAAIVDSSDDAIISKTLESVITSWNAAAERMFGYTAEEMIGESVYRLIPADRLEEEPRILSRLKGGERVEHFETKRVAKDGRLLDVSLTISPIKDAQGTIIGLSKIARDITEKKMDEARKNDFIGMVSHELKTPLTSLSAIIQVSHAKLEDSEDRFMSGAMEKAARQVKKMTDMINGFLNISRLEAGKMLIEKQTFELGLLLQEILEETRLISTHSFSLDGCDKVMVNADRDKISSVVSNLVSNAIKYSPRGKVVGIRCQVSGGMVTVSVKDEGMGIKPQDLDQIFDRYYRVETSHTRHISGFGIGLYLSAEIIKHHEGEIWVESESGQGSTFYFSLPLA